MSHTDRVIEALKSIRDKYCAWGEVSVMNEAIRMLAISDTQSEAYEKVVKEKKDFSKWSDFGCSDKRRTSAFAGAFPCDPDQAAYGFFGGFQWRTDA